MITCSATGENGQRIIVLGLTAENVDLLVDGNAIHVSAETHPGFPTDINILIMVKETEQELLEVLKPYMGPDTKIVPYTTKSKPS